MWSAKLANPNAAARSAGDKVERERPVESAAACKSAYASVAFGTFFLIRIRTLLGKHKTLSTLTHEARQRLRSGNVKLEKTDGEAKRACLICSEGVENLVPERRSHWPVLN